MEVAEGLMAKVRAADSARFGSGSPPPDELARLMEEVKSRSSTPPSEAEAAAMRREFDRLLDAMTKAGGVPPADVEEIKRSVFGYGTFFATGQEPSPVWPGGVRFRGNARGPREALLASVTAGVGRCFPQKYLVFMDVEEEGLGAEPPAPAALAPGAPPPEPRVTFTVVPAANLAPPPTTGWQLALSLLLLLLTAASAVELGLETQIASLPAETLAFFATPGALDALTPGSPVPGLAAAEPGMLLAHALPIAAGVLAAQALHEAGHVLVAKSLGATLAPPFLLPNGSVGCFGAVTQIRSILPTRAALLDLAAAGPVAGGAAAAALFLGGIAASAAAMAALPDVAAAGEPALRAAAEAAGLVPVPAALLQSSLLLGGLVSSALPPPAGSDVVYVHPALVAGWCGLTAAALNSLPLGCTDGGRVALAAFGRAGLTLGATLAYAGLALGLLGGPLSLAWGLFVVLLQRSPERPPLDAITPPDERRRRAAGALLALSVAILAPLSLSLPQ